MTLRCKWFEVTNVSAEANEIMWFKIVFNHNMLSSTLLTIPWDITILRKIDKYCHTQQIKSLNS